MPAILASITDPIEQILETDLRDFESPVDRALYIALTVGGIDGSHHKQWALDQIVRALLGCELSQSQESFEASAKYDQLIAAYQNGEDGPVTYCWDTGIAP